MKKALLASLVIGSGLLMAACSSKQTAMTAPAVPETTKTAMTSTPPTTPESMTADESNPESAMAVATTDKVAPATKTDSVDDLDKEISSYTIEQEQFN